MLAWLCLREKLPKLAVLGIALALLGVPVVTRPAALFGGERTMVGGSSTVQAAGYALAILVAMVTAGKG